MSESALPQPEKYIQTIDPFQFLSGIGVSDRDICISFAKDPNKINPKELEDLRDKWKWRSMKMMFGKVIFGPDRLKPWVGKNLREYFIRQDSTYERTGRANPNLAIKSGEEEYSFRTVRLHDYVPDVTQPNEDGSRRVDNKYIQQLTAEYSYIDPLTINPTEIANIASGTVNYLVALNQKISTGKITEEDQVWLDSLNMGEEEIQRIVSVYSGYYMRVSPNHPARRVLVNMFSILGYPFETVEGLQKGKGRLAAKGDEAHLAEMSTTGRIKVNHFTRLLNSGLVFGRNAAGRMVASHRRGFFEAKPEKVSSQFVEAVVNDYAACTEIVYQEGKIRKTNYYGLIKLAKFPGYYDPMRVDPNLKLVCDEKNCQLRAMCDHYLRFKSNRSQLISVQDVNALLRGWLFPKIKDGRTFYVVN